MLEARSGLGKTVVVLVAVAISLFAVSGAAARVIPSVSTSLTTDQVIPTGATGATVLVTSPATKLGAHADFNLNLAFDYGATAMTTASLNGSSTRTVPVPDPATYPPGSDQSESVRNLVVDLPPGLVGNPNAIPFDDRCEISTFETGTCPDSSVIGTLDLGITLMPWSVTEDPDWFPSQIGDSYVAYFPNQNANLRVGGTRIALLKTNPEVPAKIGIMVIPPQVSNALKTHDVITISPDTNGDLRLRSVASNITNWLMNALDGAHSGNIRIDYMNLKFRGLLPNGRAFMTSPTECAPWTSTVWANARYVNDNLSSDPLGTGSPQYSDPASSTITPDCSNQSSIPFPASGDVSISSPDRDTSPSFDFTISNPGVYNDGQVPTTPKRIVTTIPAAINVDVQQLSRNCQVAQFDADQCPAGSRVGSVEIETPLLLPGLKGDVYLVKRNGAGLPDLGLRLRGAISFTQRGKNSYVGDKFNQIETVFDNIPQLGFTKLKFHLDGGESGLLRTLSCPTYNKEPALPSFSYTFTAWTGATASQTTPLNMKNCFGIQKLKPYSKCLHKKLPVHPDYQSRARLKQVSLTIDGKRRATSKKRPFRFDLKLSKLNLKTKKQHSLSLKAVYDDGSVSEKKTKFKVCKR